MGEICDISSITASLRKCEEFSKCKKCGCLQETLDGIKKSLLQGGKNTSSGLLSEVEVFLSKMESIEYT